MISLHLIMSREEVVGRRPISVSRKALANRLCCPSGLGVDASYTGLTPGANLGRPVRVWFCAAVRSPTAQRESKGRRGRSCCSWARARSASLRASPRHTATRRSLGADSCFASACQNPNPCMFLGFSGSPIEKTRIKCGKPAVFPQARVLR